LNDLWLALGLAVLQGLTEFLPVSSSGHLQALKQVTDSPLAADLTLDILLHFATLLAVFVVYRKDYLRVISGVWKRGEPRRELALVLLGTIPAGIVGLVFKDRVEALPDTHPYLLPLCWAAMGIALLGERGRLRGDREIDVRAAIWIGCWQALAILPGISRSGTTILAALWFGVGREAAARYSFLITAPLIIGATALEVPDLVAGEGMAGSPWIIGLAFVTAFVVGLGALLLVLRLLRRGRLHWFGPYVLLIAAAFTLWLRYGRGP
jgi:undecaprenyl-diphosphatase